MNLKDHPKDKEWLLKKSLVLEGAFQAMATTLHIHSQSEILFVANQKINLIKLIINYQMGHRDHIM